VADEFSKKYYEVLHKHPKYIHRFYKDESQFDLTIREAGKPEQKHRATGLEVSKDLHGQSWLHLTPLPSNIKL
jgi:hypothetical protein